MLGYFPDPHPDELLYSLCGRYTDRMQYSTKRIVLELLFGHKGSVSSIDLPNRLGYFAASLPPEYCYGVDNVINQHTLLPYYDAFLPLDKISLVRQDMTTDSNRAILRTGLNTTHIKPPEQLRYCPICVEEDRKHFGECYWHRVHQLPGVEVCPHHAIWLEQSNVSVRRKMHQYEFISAEKAVPTTSKARNLQLTDASHQDLLYIAQESAWLLSHPHPTYNLETLRKQYTVAFIERGLASYEGTVVLVSKLLHQFRQRFPRQILDLLHCNFDENNTNSWLYRLYSGAPLIHPLYHLLGIRFLGYTLHKFVDLPTNFYPFGQGPWPCLNPVCQYYHQLKINHIEINYRGGAKRPTAKFACECGFVYFRTGPDQSPEDQFRRNVRVETYGPIWEEALKQLWKKPDLSKEKVAEQLGVGANTVYQHAARLGLIPPSLKLKPNQINPVAKPTTEKDQATLQSEVEMYQAQWLAILEANKDKGRKEIIKENRLIYTWLHQNDPAWLKANMPCKKTRKHPRSRIDWSKRDEQLAKRIEESAERLRAKAGRPERITISLIAQDIGEPNCLFKVSNKLPKTAEMLKQVTETRETFAIRRIHWAVEFYIQKQVPPRRWEFIECAGVSAAIREIPKVKKALEDALSQLNSLR